MKENKIIYKVTKKNDGFIVKEKLTVVYRNKTYTYCKISGSDELLCVDNKYICMTIESLNHMTSGTIYSYADAETDDMLKGIFRDMRYKQYKTEMLTNKISIDRLKDRIKIYEDNLRGMIKFIEEYERSKNV